MVMVMVRARAMVRVMVSSLDGHHEAHARQLQLHRVPQLRLVRVRLG